MTQLGEAIAIGLIAPENEITCPYAQAAEGVDQTEREHIAQDDKTTVLREQANDGGTLGRNLISGSPGASGTVGGPFEPPKQDGALRVDTRRAGVHVRVPGTDEIETGVYGFVVAAHHLIPGEASLAPSELHKMMVKDGSVQVVVPGGATKQKKVRKHIGYNVNGAHNGVWLPGNYHIRARSSPIQGKGWSDLGNNPWCRNYVAAVAKAAGGQMHDAHTKYSAAVEECLNKIAAILVEHECKDCEGDEINPPFRIKSRLYTMSGFLRGQLTAGPMAWKRPWFTSDRWSNDAFQGDKPSPAFIKAYTEAALLQRGER